MLMMMFLVLPRNDESMTLQFMDMEAVNDFTSAVSSVLNMSDGLMSDIFNGKFICTFNADISSIDDAILRKGRCYAKYKFGKLDKEKAKVLLNERGIYLDAYDDMTLADIYNYDCKNVENSANRRKIGFKKCWIYSITKRGKT